MLTADSLLTASGQSYRVLYLTHDKNHISQNPWSMNVAANLRKIVQNTPHCSFTESQKNACCQSRAGVRSKFGTGHRKKRCLCQ